MCYQGYALIEYATLDEAKAAIEGANGTKLLDLSLAVDFAFVRPPPNKGGQAGAARGGRQSAGVRRGRSRSPEGGRDRERSPARDDAEI
jgi:RNA-binding protein 8A